MCGWRSRAARNGPNADAPSTSASRGLWAATRARSAQTRSAYRETAAVHDTSQEYGVAENMRGDQGGGGVPVTPDGSEMQEASDQVQGEGAKVKTIVREAPKVGRNDPCPCGSGKKYKKCCGASAD